MEFKIGCFGCYGKTAVTLRFLKGEFSDGYLPTIEDEFTKNITVNNQDIRLSVIDTAGQDDFAEMRYSYFSQVQGFLLFFDISKPSTIDDIRSIYEDILDTVDEEEPSIIIGALNCEMRSTNDKINLVSKEEIQEISKEFHCEVIEVSASTGIGVDSIFTKLVQKMLNNQESNKNNGNETSKINNEIIQDDLEETSTLTNESQNDSVSEEEDEIQMRCDTESSFVSAPVLSDNSQYSGRKFGLIMTLNETDYNNGEKVNLEEDELLFGEDIKLALTMEKDKRAFLNPAGLKLTITEPNIENDVFQQFTFGKDEWNTVIDSVQQRGMVWDAADEFNFDPPSGTPFYLFPFHGRHNQRFVYNNNMINAQQNGQVVTFVGGDEPFVMMPPSNQLRARQTFSLQLL